MSELIVTAIEPHIVPIFASCIFLGISAWWYTDRRYKERQREERMSAEAEDHYDPEEPVGM